MSITNNVSIVISNEAIQKINEGLKMVTDNLPKLVTLTPAERQMLPKMGDKTLAFVTKSLEYAKQNSKIVPAYLNMDEFAKDVNAANQLFQIMAPLQKIAEELDDTSMLAGSEAYAEALAFYSSLKAAINAGETGLKNVYDDLSSRFPGRGAKKAEIAESIK
jgi:hypothetical protein